MGRLGNGLLVGTVLVAACAGADRPTPATPTSTEQSAPAAVASAAPTRPAINDPAWTGPTATRPADDRPVVVSKDELLLCAEADKQVKSFDFSGDGKADIWKLYRAAAPAGPAILTCRKADLDLDGRVDTTSGYRADGTLLFEQFDVTFNGHFDILKRYDPATKVAIEVAHDSDGNGLYDIFESYSQEGELILIARDRNADNALDVWEIHEAGELVERQFDDDYDGVADRTE